MIKYTVIISVLFLCVLCLLIEIIPFDIISFYETTTFRTHEYFNKEQINTNHLNKDSNEKKYEELYKNSSNYSFVQPSYVDEKLNLSNFNFEGKCREPFKYKPNNKRDLLFTGIKYDNTWVWKKDKE